MIISKLRFVFRESREQVNRRAVIFMLKDVSEREELMVSVVHGFGARALSPDSLTHLQTQVKPHCRAMGFQLLGRKLFCNSVLDARVMVQIFCKHVQMDCVERGDEDEHIKFRQTRDEGFEHHTPQLTRQSHGIAPDLPH
jgi:hypothetical protein